MATKKQNNTKANTTTHKSGGVTKQSVLRALSYLGLVISALVFLVGGILKLCNLGQVASVLTQISSLLMLVAIAWPAWDFCRSKAQWVRYLYFIALALYILGAIFGFLKL